MPCWEHTWGVPNGANPDPARARVPNCHQNDTFLSKRNTSCPCSDGNDQTGPPKINEMSLKLARNHHSGDPPIEPLHIQRIFAPARKKPPKKISAAAGRLLFRLEASKPNTDATAPDRRPTTPNSFPAKNRARISP